MVSLALAGAAVSRSTIRSRAGCAPDGPRFEASSARICSSISREFDVGEADVLAHLAEFATDRVERLGPFGDVEPAAEGAELVGTGVGEALHHAPAALKGADAGLHAFGGRAQVSQALRRGFGQGLRLRGRHAGLGGADRQRRGAFALDAQRSGIEPHGQAAQDERRRAGGQLDLDQPGDAGGIGIDHDRVDARGGLQLGGKGGAGGDEGGGRGGAAEGGAQVRRGHVNLRKDRL